MLGFTLRRLAVSVPVVLLSTVVVFVMVSLSGDPLDKLRSRTPPPPPQVVAIERHRLHLDQSMPHRYWTWLTGLLHGDLGPSVRANLHIGHEIVTRVDVTMRLVAAAFVLALVIAIVAGVVSAVKQYTGIDHFFSFSAFLFLSMPSFWFAILLKQAGVSLNAHLNRQVVYTIGEKSVIAPPGAWARLNDLAGHLILPTISLALVSFGAWSRFQRASMLEVLNSDYVRLARAKGLRPGRILVRHALRNALTPLVTVTALDLAALVSGAVLTETVFQWHGMGDLLTSSIAQRDVYAVLAWLLVAAVAIVVLNLIADLLYMLLDPRVRHA